MTALSARSRTIALTLALALLAGPVLAQAPESWQRAFPKTDFSRHAVPYAEIRSGGVPKDGIPSIDDPEFAPVAARRDWLADREPVIGLSIDGDARAYPLRVLTWHEIVNDTVGGTPVAVTYCPLCNAAIVFEATVDGQRLSFGTTGKLRHSDLVMYDRQTGTWWQQFTGRGIVGAHTGRKLTFVPARLESWGNSGTATRTGGCWCRATRTPGPTAATPTPATTARSSRSFTADRCRRNCRRWRASS